MSNTVDVLAVLGTSRMETSTFAAKAGVPLRAARVALKRAEALGLVVSQLGGSDIARYRFRRGAAIPLIWRAALAACGLKS